MKTKLFILLGLLTAVIFLSCDTVALGTRLDLNGPIVNITTPEARKAVSAEFTITGTIEDYSEIKSFLLTVSCEGDEFAKQWRYNGKWEISVDFGKTWSDYLPEDISWVVASHNESCKSDCPNKHWNWTIPVDMTLDGEKPDDGEYLFTAQAWDVGTMSDDNSLSTRVLIVDKFPPKVDIVNLVLYRGSTPWENEPLKPLHDITDDSDARFDPSNIGKFLTQGFDVKWQVEDNHDVKSVEFRFYKYDEYIDNDTSTPLPDNYIYQYYVNLPDPGTEPLDSIKPNGDFSVPALDGDIKGSYDGELNAPINEKTTVMIAAMCYDAAGNPNQEKIIGYFVYWPLADEPWIIYTEGMEKPEHYLEIAGQHLALEDILKEHAFMIYPGRTIKANAYHNHGVKNVNYSLYTFNEFTGEKSALPINSFDKIEIPNPPRPNGTFATVFPWEFRPPARSGYFVVEATATSAGVKDKDDKGIPQRYIEGSGRESPMYTALFRVQDISFPDFPEPVNPSASDPMFMHVDVDENTVTFYGIVRDATQVETLDMVWINPESAGFATQNQIRFFREPDFEGWRKIEELTQGQTSITLSQNSTYIEEDVLESEAILNNTHPTGVKHPNKIWRLAVEWKEEDQDTRQVFTFSITINLDDFNIGLGTGKQPLKSQVFLFKAKNPDNRTTIITYAPQGDESPPVIAIQDVTIGAVKYIPQEFAMIPRFLGGEKITINGTWREDSAQYLPIADYFSGNFKASINTIPLTNITVSYNNPSVQSTTGTWTAVVDVFTGMSGTGINANNLNDSLVVAVETKDFGGNVSEAGGSWLVESDDLRLIRISSNDDGTFRAGQTVTIFLEFSKAVQLLYSGSAPTLTLNSSTGANATAIYKPNGSQSTRQEFVYTVGANHSASRLNVIGITSTPNTWSQDNYPFTWVRGSGETREEIRVTMNQGHTVNTPNPSGGPTMPSGRLYARQLPVTADSNNADYQFTLTAGKNIRIDTAPPTIVSIENTISGTAAQHFSSGDIFIRVKFSEPVMIGSTVPRLQLRLHNNRTVETSSSLDDVRVSGTDITFKYTIQNGDTTGNNPIIVTGITGGAITDLAGTPYSASFTTTNIANRFINTLAPAVPTVRLFSTQVTATNAIDANVVTNTVGTTVNYGTSSTANSVYANRTLSNVYHQNLFIAVQSSNSSVSDTNAFTGNNNLQENTGLEYSVVNSATRNWVKVAQGNMDNSPFSGLLPGTYRLVARQINRAGIVSAQTPEITFTWDPGELITRISSTTANGTYTNATDRNQIAITVFFRKNVSIAANSTITLNARRGAAGSSFSTANSQVQLTGTVVNNASSITYTYNIQNGDNTPPDTNLDVTGINIIAWDGTTPNNGVRNNLTSIDTLSPTMRLNGNKEFRVSTGNLTNTAPVFSADSGVETDSNFHGIRRDDGSYWTTLEIPFNRPVSKGTGDIVIEQVATNYRVPTVLTETQYNRFRGVANFDTYYFKGTNGYIYTSADDQGSDTTSKYILQYNYNPSSAVTANNSAFAGDAFIPAAFFTAFRQAERITIPVAAQAVTIDGNTVKIRLSGSNAPQVPGATYAVSYPAGFVQDELGNVNAVAANVNVTLRGVAKPFVRIRKTQDTITTATGSMTQPRFVAVQPLLAYARMDCRTPGSTIRPVITSGYSNTTGVSGTDANQNNWSTGGNPNDMTGTTAARPAAPTTTTAAGTSAAQTTLGTDTGTNAIQGYMWWVRAIATTGTTNIVSSTEAEEVAFRTVITYQLRGSGAGGANGGGAEQELTASAAQGEAIMTSGESIWIRGGDAIGSSSIPGFPVTWEENWNTVSKRRAGIRLMSKVNAANNTANTASNLNNSVWRYITWDINTTAYVDFVKGNDTASNAATVWQYGPTQWAYQRSGWTSFKIKYPIYPGKHRWCDTAHDWAGKYALNFSGTYSGRPTLTSDYDAWPGINTQ
ncbi:MAG: hypothetical protein FWB95_04930 [Treponema sp.]|nr:hypothetical protein [Treponema sp.]